MSARIRRVIVMLAISVMSVQCITSSARAGSNKKWRVVSDVGVYSVGAMAFVTPAIHRDWEGVGRAGLSVGVGIGVTTGLKSLIDSRRPDKSGNDSFPSGHATTAFASATTLYLRHGWQVGFPAYAVATLTAVSRKLSRRHHWVDVAAGAVIGSASGWLFTNKFNDKVQLWPWAERDGGGLTVAVKW